MITYLENLITANALSCNKGHNISIFLFMFFAVCSLVNNLHFVSFLR